MNFSLVMMEVEYVILFPGYSHMEIVLLKSSIRIHRKHVDENS